MQHKKYFPMLNKNCNKNNTINSPGKTNKLQNNESAQQKPEEQRDFEKILNFFKSTGKAIVNVIEWIKAEEKKPGKWIMVKPPERINDNDLPLNNKHKKDLSTILEVPEDLEQSTEIDTTTRLNQKDSTQIQKAVDEFRQAMK